MRNRNFWRSRAADHIRELRWIAEEKFGLNIRKQFDERMNKTLKHFFRQRLRMHKPLQYIIGNQPFCDLKIAVRPPVLIPRYVA